MDHPVKKSCTYITASGLQVMCDNLDPLEEPLILKAIGGDKIIVISELGSAYIVDYGVILVSPLAEGGAVAGDWYDLDWTSFNPDFPGDQKALNLLAGRGIKPNEVLGE